VHSFDTILMPGNGILSGVEVAGLRGTIHFAYPTKALLRVGLILVKVRLIG